MDSKRRKIVNSEGRQMIAKMYHFFKEEYAFMLAHNNKSDLSVLRNIRQRTADATGISIGTVTRILKEEKNLSSSSARFISPMKKRLKRDNKVDVDNFKAEVIRTTIQNFHVIHKQIPTLAKLQTVLIEKIGFNSCLATLRKLLRKLGYRWRKTENNKKVLQERHDIQMWRLQYLKQISDYRSHGRPIVYTDESYILKTHVRDSHWALKREKIIEISEEEKRYILVHAATKDGFIRNASLLYKANATMGDYHSNMSFDNYVKWLNDKLLPNLPKRAVIILDNATYHNVLAEKLPTSASNKSEMQNWLTRKGIPFQQELCKVELYEIIKKNKDNFVTYKIDNIIKSRGFDVLRLPPYHPELNAFENIWGVLKNYIAFENIDLNKHNIERLIEDSMENIQQEMWRNTCDSVQSKEQEYMDYFDCDSELIINLQQDSDETDTDDHSNDSGCF